MFFMKIIRVGINTANLSYARRNAGVNNNNTRIMKLNKKLIAAAACAALPFASQLSAEESPWSFSASLDFNSHFMSYGANVWGDDTDDIGDEILFQPSAQVDYAINDTMGAYAGIWFDINGLATGDIDWASEAGSDIQEIDVWVGYWVTSGDLTLDFTLQQWYYAGETEGILDITVSYDTLFAPYLRIHNRIEAVGDQNKGTIYEIGGTLYEGEYEGISYGFSVGGAFNFDEYHVDGEDGYAYSFIGGSASYVFYSTDSLDIDLHGGLTYYATDEDNTGNADSGYLTGNIGVGFSF